MVLVYLVLVTMNLNVQFSRVNKYRRGLEPQVRPGSLLNRNLTTFPFIRTSTSSCISRQEINITHYIIIIIISYVLGFLRSTVTHDIDHEQLSIIKSQNPKFSMFSLKTTKKSKCLQIVQNCNQFFFTSYENTFRMKTSGLQYNYFRNYNDTTKLEFDEIVVFSSFLGRFFCRVTTKLLGISENDISKVPTGQIRSPETVQVIIRQKKC